MLQLIGFVDWLFGLYMWIVIANAILSWLAAFNVVNMRNPFVYSVGNALYRLTEPVLRPVRRVLPPMGGLDLSPVVVLLAVVFIREVLLVNLAQSVARGGF